VCAAVYGWFQKPAAPSAVATPPPAVVPASVPANVPAEVAATQLALQVGLTAGEETWIQVSSDGKPVFTSALHANESKLIEASEKVQVLVGNAGGLEIRLNGKPIGPIGPKGQVRVVELTPAGFQIVPRKLPAVEPL
ncbi:MAG: DUF4115 domain-containing protein, partial [Bryobacteraceae bacterium]